MINTGSNHVEVPFGIDIVIRDAEEIIIGAELLIPDYPILPPNTPMGFTSLPLRESFSEVDPTTVSIDVESALAMESGAKDRLDAKSIEIVSAVDVSTGDGSLQIEITLKNTSDSDFENGFDPRVSVWDDEGLYCGNAFANMFSRLPAGDTVRFTTQSQGSIPNPLDLAGDDYTWKVWIAPR